MRRFSLLLCLALALPMGASAGSNHTSNPTKLDPQGQLLNDLVTRLNQNADVTARVDPVTPDLERYLDTALNYRVWTCRHEVIRNRTSVESKLAEIHPDTFRTLKAFWPPDLPIRMEAIRVPAQMQKTLCQVFEAAIVTGNVAVHIEVDRSADLGWGQNPLFD